MRIGVLGSGTGSNCEAILQACERGQIPGRVVVVVSDIADALILERARKRGIPTHFVGPSRFKTKLEPEFEQQIVDILRKTGVELVALAGYMRVVKTPLLSAFAGKMLNVHPSLLPAFPGLHAWEQALTYGVRVTGCTVHFVNEGVDAGPVIFAAGSAGSAGRYARDVAPANSSRRACAVTGSDPVVRTGKIAGDGTTR